MKKLFSEVAALIICAAASAQSTDTLNYSGKMYVSSIEVITTPRYVSFEDHAILSSEMTIPAIEITKVMFDFENGNPYFQEITKTDDGVKIARMNLSSRPSPTSPEDALLQFLGGLGSI